MVTVFGTLCFHTPNGSTVLQKVSATFAFQSNTSNQEILFSLSGFAPEHEEVVEAISLPPAPIGKIALQHSSSQIGDTLYEGSVFLDGRPVCDNAWDDNEALVVCRYGRPVLFLRSRSRTILPFPRIFGYNRAVARSYSHFGGVEEGTQFAISDLRSCLSFRELTWFQTNFAL